MDIQDPSDSGEEFCDESWLPRRLIAPWTEIIAVLAMVIGYSAFVSTKEALRGSSHRYMNLILTNSQMLHGLAIEGAIFALLLFFLHRRGWGPGDFRIKSGVWSSLQGFGLLVAMMLGNSITVASLFVLTFTFQHAQETFPRFMIENAPHFKPHSIDISWATLVPAMILNAYFEEITTMAYAFNQLASKWGPKIALPVVVLLRMSCHTYQGPIHATGIGVAFLISGMVYWRTCNLWPLIFAHILLDLLSMGAIKLMFGR